jgi:hypothetical protein
MPSLFSAAQTASATGCPAKNVSENVAAYNLAPTFLSFLDRSSNATGSTTAYRRPAAKLDLQLVSETGNPQSHYDNARFFRSYTWWNRNVYLELHRS